MKKLNFQTTGSTGEIYNITLISEGDETHFLCTCPAGSLSNKVVCKHRKRLIAGDTSHLINPDASSLAALPALIEAATWRATIAEIDATEAEIQKLKKRLEKLKRDAAKAMNGPGASYF